MGPLNFNSHRSHSFPPLIYEDVEILILGSLPGKKSIELKEYYGHPRNRMWKILCAITNCDLPTDYASKKIFLQKNKIGLWDVASSAERKGSLDSNIKKETPNDVDNLLINYPSINVIGFNGKKSESMYKKFFKLNRSIKFSLTNSKTFYYFNAYSQSSPKLPVIFSVPSGNFGNLTAGIFSKFMGLPVEKFVASTNLNDTVPRYMQTGIYIIYLWKYRTFLRV